MYIRVMLSTQCYNEHISVRGPIKNNVRRDCLSFLDVTVLDPLDQALPQLRGQVGGAPGVPAPS